MLRLHFGDRSLGDVGFDIVVAQNILDDLTKSREVFEQIDFRQIVQVVNDTSKVNVSPGCLYKNKMF